MSILDSVSRNFKNIFVGSHKGDDIKSEWLEPINTEKNQEVKPSTNDLGVDPHEWFEAPNVYPPAPKPEWEDTAPCEYEPSDDWFSTPHNEKEEEITMHEKMYRMATARYNPFSLGGSENCDSDISCNLGGSENLHEK